MGRNFLKIILISFWVLKTVMGYKGNEMISTHESTSHISVDQRVSKPDNLSILAISSTELNVTWNHPPGDMPKYYLVSWQVDGFPTEESAGTTFYVIDELDPCTSYDIDVISVGSDNSESDPARGTGTTNPTEPPQPMNVTIATLASDSATVSWGEPEYDCGVLKYSVNWEWTPYWGDGQEGGDGQGETVELEFDIPNLTPYSSLTVCVTSVFQTFEGEPACATGDTEQAPPGPPVILEATSDYGFSTVTWEPPENENGVIENYRISWKSNDAAENSTVVGIVTSINLQLEPCESYIIFVSAKTAADAWGPPSNETEVDVLNNAIPESVSCSTSENNLKVDWTSKYSCPVENYKIFWESFVIWSSSNNSGEIIINGTSHTYEQKGSSNTQYGICIGTLTEGVDSDEVVCCRMETEEGVPSEPQIETINQAYINAHLTWKPPEQLNGIITTYKITWRSSSDDVGYVTKNGTEHEASFALDICKTYEITVTAETSKGQGNESLPASLTMENYVPPDSVSCTNGPGGSVTVSWNTASSCSVSGFLVEYNWNSLWSEEQGSKSESVGPNSMNLPLLDVLPYSQVDACVGVGNTLDADSCCETVTNQEVPGPSENMTCELITASVANITWIEPTEINGVLGDWFLSWSIENEEPLNVTLDSETNYYELLDLIRNADYNVTLQASTEAGFGDESSCILKTPAAEKESNVGAIVGGIIGAILGIILIACAVFFGMKWKKHRSDKRLNARRTIERRNREREQTGGKEKKPEMSSGEIKQENIYGDVSPSTDHE